MSERYDPDGGLRRTTLGYCVLVAGLTSVMWYVLATRRFGLEGKRATAFALVGAGASAVLAYRMATAVADAAGRLAKTTMAGGGTTPYEEQFSYQEAMAARGDVAGALESYEAIIAERPMTVAPRLRAAELHAKAGNDPHRAAALLREVRDLPTATQRETIYAALRLIDLYDGALGEPGRALVEMRRLVDRYPDSDVAASLRNAIARIKSERAAEGEQG